MSNLVGPSGIKSIQRGKINMASAATASLAISAVNVAKAQVNLLGVTARSGTTGYDCTAELASATTVTIYTTGTCDASASPLNQVSVEVIEYW